MHTVHLALLVHTIHSIRRSRELRGHSVCRNDLACQLLMTSKSKHGFVKDKAVVSLFVLRGRMARGVWVSDVQGDKFSANKKMGSFYGALVFLLLLCMYSIISDVTYSVVLKSGVIC